MNGEMLRDVHGCEVPGFAEPGSIWRCDCGRRWKRILHMQYPTGGYWRRALWPARLSRKDAR